MFPKFLHNFSKNHVRRCSTNAKTKLFLHRKSEQKTLKGFILLLAHSMLFFKNFFAYFFLIGNR